jgi:hypothetical protein
MPNRPKDEDFTSEYAKFALNSRGVPDDFDTWVTDIGGRALREVSKKKKNREGRRMRDSGDI